MPHEFHEQYLAQPLTPARARHSIAGYLTAEGLAELTPTVLLVSELVTNAVLYAGESITVRANVTDDTLNVAAHDPSDDLPLRRERSTPADALGLSAEGGRGLHIVTTLAVDWGVTPANGNGSGKSTWFELQR